MVAKTTLWRNCDAIKDYTKVIELKNDYANA